MADYSSAPLEPPHNAEVERALLGALLMAPKRLEDVADFLKPEQFYEPLHNLIFDTMLALSRDNKPVDITGLRAVLRGMSTYDEMGADTYLAALAGAAVTTVASSVKHYGEVLVDLSLRRSMIEQAIILAADCREAIADRSARDILDKHEASLMKLTGARDASGGLVPFHEVLNLTLADWEAETKGARGVPTGFIELDNLIGGLHPTDLIIVAARPAMGKSALAVNIAFNAAVYFHTSDDIEHRNRQVVFFSLEMSTAQLGSRIITGETKIVAPRNRWGQTMQEQEWARALDVVEQRGRLPFWVDETPDQTVSRMRARCVRLHRKKPIGLIVIDYLQLIDSDMKSRDTNRVEQVSQITRGLKKLAKELQVPILALSQLSRGVESRENKRPLLSDLRESGSLEQDSDIVMFPFRAEYYLNQEGRPQRRSNENEAQYSTRIASHFAAVDAAAGKCEIIVAKQRHGPTGSAWLHYDKARTWFEDAAPEAAPPQDNLL